MENTNLDKEFRYYIKNQKTLVEQYRGKFIVIKDEQVKGVYNSEIEAYQGAQKEHQLGSFLIQKVEEGENSYSQTFYSLVGI